MYDFSNDSGNVLDSKEWLQVTMCFSWRRIPCGNCFKVCITVIININNSEPKLDEFEDDVSEYIKNRHGYDVACIKMCCHITPLLRISNYHKLWIMKNMFQNEKQNKNEIAYPMVWRPLSHIINTFRFVT